MAAVYTRPNAHALDVVRAIVRDQETYRAMGRERMSVGGREGGFRRHGSSGAGPAFDDTYAWQELAAKEHNVPVHWVKRAVRMDRNDPGILNRLTTWPPRRELSRPRVYFVESPRCRAIKIGHTEQPGDDRITGWHTVIPGGVVVLAVVRGEYRDEQAYHAQFEHTHINGEWYEDTLELRDAIKKAQLAGRAIPTGR